ncbi:hypothetical protein JVX90_14405 [Gordonia sp. PDNC005]|nr:hypothetical protein JVX90_14405 [Gordonia sp. PDNC005]
MPVGTAQLPPGLPPNTSTAGLQKLRPTNRPGLPRTVELRTPKQSFNQRWEFTLAGGDLLTRQRGGSTWRVLGLPGCLRDRLTTISVDDDEMLAADRHGRVFTLDNLLREPATWNWTRAWGAPLWQGDGTRLPATTGDRWSWSVSSPWTTKTFSDDAGTNHPLGQGKVSHIIALVGDGSRIVTQDPWLADDYSYEIGSPHNGRFQSEALSASGSTTFIINKYGDMYTRLYDFDNSGSDIVFYRYSWADQRGKPDAPDLGSQRLNPTYAAVQLPSPGWRQQPKIPGEITSSISIHQTGSGSQSRELRVEGRNYGFTGFWHKPIYGSSWSFTQSGRPLRKPLLDNSPEDRSLQTLAAPSTKSFTAALPVRGNASGYKLEVDEFNWAASARTATVTAPTGTTFTVVLHTVDGLRQLPIPQGLSSTPRDMYGAIELAPGQSSTAAKTFKKRWLGGAAVSPIQMTITNRSMVIR